MLGKTKNWNPGLEKLAPGSPISRRTLICGGAVLTVERLSRPYCRLFRREVLRAPLRCLR
jgi:hypothetical protein